MLFLVFTLTVLCCSQVLVATKMIKYIICLILATLLSSTGQGTFTGQLVDFSYIVSYQVHRKVMLKYILGFSV